MMIKRLVLAAGFVALHALSALAHDPVYLPHPVQPPRVLVPGPTQGPPQRYVILQPGGHGVGHGVHPQPYAYGWFGAAYRQHYEYGRGYYGDTRVVKPYSP